eukprot:1178437-Prorocentrum_minimum.AAC.3
MPASASAMGVVSKTRLRRLNVEHTGSKVTRDKDASWLRARACRGLSWLGTTSRAAAGGAGAAGVSDSVGRAGQRGEADEGEGGKAPERTRE